MADREPLRAASRPTGEMQPHSSPPATPHSTHDLLPLAAAADRDPDPTLRAAAAAQRAGCAECAALFQELRSIAVGLAALPPRPAPRDMRLSPDQAARLRRGTAWRRLLRPFGEGGLPGLRPLAAVLTTLGLGGILLTALPLGLATGGGILDAIGSPLDGRTGAAYSAAPAPAMASSPGSAENQPGSKNQPSLPVQSTSGADAGPEASGAGPTAPQNDSFAGGSFSGHDAGTSLPPLLVVSLGLAAGGLGLFALLFLGRRVA